MNYTYTLAGGGYTISANERVLIDQPFDPEKPFIGGAPQPFDSDEAAAAHAEAVIAAMTDADTSDGEE